MKHTPKTHYSLIDGKAICGAQSNRVYMTNTVNEVSCQRCLKILTVNYPHKLQGTIYEGASLKD